MTSWGILTDVSSFSNIRLALLSAGPENESTSKGFTFDQ
jgi:hypothetical protein